MDREITYSSYKQISYFTPPDILEKASENTVLENLLLTWSGLFTKAYGHIVSNRVVEDYVLIYCVDGKGWLNLNDQSWSIQAGDLFICPPNMSHSYGADEIEPWTKYWIHFRGKNAAAYMDLLGLTSSSPIIKVGINPKFISWFHEILAVLKMGYTQSNLLYATSYLTNILSYLTTLAMNSVINKNDNINIESIIHLMLDNLNESLSLEELSEFAKLSKYHFVRIFKEKTGYTPIDYFIRLKIQKACELLELSNLKINEISSVLAFNSPYYFSIAFKKITGKSPQHYRDTLTNRLE